MANDRHLENLHDETDVWHRWREENAHVMPDLHEADLRLAILVGAALNETDLRSADLRMAGLSNADLNRAELGAADFSDATCTDGSKCAQGTNGGCNGG